MKKWVIRTLIGLLLFVIFVILTFDWGRLNPRLAQWMSSSLSSMFRRSYVCEISNLQVRWNLKIKLEGLKCSDTGGQTLIHFDELDLWIMPFYQNLRVRMGSGFFEASTNSKLGGSPSTLRASLVDLQISRFSVLLLSLANSFLFPTVTNVLIEGLISGSISWPLKNQTSSNGEIKLNLSRILLPQQSYLELLGLPEININPTKLNLELQKGVLSFKEAALTSDFFSGKLEGQLSVAESFAESTGDMIFKWKVQSSDALKNSLIGQILLNTPCPSPDALGFCTRRLNRLSDFQTVFTPSFR